LWRRETLRILAVATRGKSNGNCAKLVCTVNLKGPTKLSKPQPNAVRNAREYNAMSGLSYKDSGVNLDIYNESMGRLPRLMHRTFSPRVQPLDGGFAGLFKLDFDNPLFRRNYVDPVLVSCTDGVGTKLKVAIEANRITQSGSISLRCASTMPFAVGRNPCSF
jgi:hypothetical protein